MPMCTVPRCDARVGLHRIRREDSNAIYVLFLAEDKRFHMSKESFNAYGESMRHHIRKYISNICYVNLYKS